MLYGVLKSIILRNIMSKVGRNDPCPCGSGKKYKQCCWKKRLPLGKRKFKASVIRSGNTAKQLPDLMERTFGEAISKAQESGLTDAIKKALPSPEDMPKVDANESLKEYLQKSREAEKSKKSDESA